MWYLWPLFLFPFTMHLISIKTVLSEDLSYEIIIHWFLWRSDKTSLTVYQVVLVVVLKRNRLCLLNLNLIRKPITRDESIRATNISTSNDHGANISLLTIFFYRFDLIWFIVFNATFNNISAISWRPVSVVEEAGVSGENHGPWASNW